MQPDASHIKQIKVISNTHWDREFRRSFEKTRRRLLDMMDITLDILERDPAYHSFTLDGHAILIDDYLEMRPERRPQVDRFLKSGRLIAGPWFTLAEEFSISGEALVRNFALGRQTVEEHGGRVPNVAYTPSSWGQTGQLPQILQGFGIGRMMFYRGISHNESAAEWRWQAPDGSEVLASRFALYARYNWYYQVHRPVTVGTDFDKTYTWGRDEAPLRWADGLAGEDLAFDLKDPRVTYDKSKLKDAIEKMVQAEGPHFTTPVFLAMHGHDISVAHPLESQIIQDARQVLGKRYAIEHTDLEGYWNEAEKHLVLKKLPVLKGERRSYLKEGMWTYLFPGTISARTYMKQQDFAATAALVSYAEPLASLALSLGAEYPATYMARGWRFLLENHTHDANGGCAPDIVCQDMSYRYRKASDIGEIVAEDAVAHICKNLSPRGQTEQVMQLVVFNPLPFERDVTAYVDVEVPRGLAAQAVALSHPDDADVARQAISQEKSSSFVDSVWDVPTILDSTRIKCHAAFRRLPALGYRAYTISPVTKELRPPQTLITGPNTMQNEHLRVAVNANGTLDVTDLDSGRSYASLNYLSDEGEVGNAWRHVSPTFDRKFNSLGVSAHVAVVESGPLVARIAAEYRFAVPIDYADGTRRNDILVDLPVRVEYRLAAGARRVEVTLTGDNVARDHWLRANLPTGLKTDVTVADSHFDVVERPIPLPDSTGWVERAEGTHPLRTFVSMNDGKAGIALMPKGLYEYEAFEDDKRTLALTLIRACRIKLAVSEEKQTELPDPGVQCPGVQRFEYAIAFTRGDWASGDLLNAAADYATPPRIAMVGRGKGSLPLAAGLFTMAGANVQVTAVKQAQDGQGLIVRLFNGLDRRNTAALKFAAKLKSARLCRMDESDLGAAGLRNNALTLDLKPKQIATVRVVLS